MRIDAYNQITQAYGIQRKTKAAKPNAVAGYSDHVTISQTGRDYQIARKAVAEAADVREDKVNRIKAMIDAGTYSVEPGDFASKLLAKYNGEA